MVTVEAVIGSLQKMPHESSYDEILERIRLLKAIDEGLEQAQQGKVVSGDMIKNQLKAWSKK
jgi:predicted transcriptional regulator